MILMDIDTLRRTKTTESKLSDFERKYLVDFRTEQDGTWNFVVPQRGELVLPLFYNTWLEGKGARYTLLRVIVDKKTNRVCGYRMYDFADKTSEDIMFNSMFVGDDLAKTFHRICFSNAQWVQLAFKGGFYMEELYPKMYI